MGKEKKDFLCILSREGEYSRDISPHQYTFYVVIPPKNRDKIEFWRAHLCTVLMIASCTLHIATSRKIQL